MYSTGGSVRTAVRVYTNGVQITDQAVINKFTTPDKMSTPSFIGPDTGSIVFTKADTLVIAWVGRKYSLSKTGDRMIFYSTDFINYDNVTNLNYMAQKYHGPTHAVTTVRGPAYAEQLVVDAEGNYKSLNLIYMVTRITNATTPRYAQTSATALNEFNPQVISQLGPKDTLAVAEYNLTYTAR